MVTINNSINNTVGGSNSGVTNTLTVTNSSDTASSAANVLVSVGGGTAADPQTTYTVSGVTSYAEGIDNSASDALVSSLGTALGTNNFRSVSSAGEINYPLQPAFLALLASTDADVTGDGTAFTLGSTTALTEIFDQNSDFNTNGTFTAPVTGVYLLGGRCDLLTVGALHTSGNFSIVTTARTYVFVSNPGISQDSNAEFTIGGTTLANMTAGNTATFSIRVFNSTKTVDAGGDAGGLRTSVWGYLVA